MISGTYREWNASLSRARSELAPGVILKLRRQLAFLTLGGAVEIAPGQYERLTGVVQLTPVDEGPARASWSVTATNGPPRNGPENARTTGGSIIRSATLEQTIWITSNKSYITVLEHGSYPDPVQRGTRLRDGSYVIRSAGGFSKQAPAGMVGVTFRQILKALRSGRFGSGR